MDLAPPAAALLVAFALSVWAAAPALAQPSDPAVLPAALEGARLEQREIARVPPGVRIRSAGEQRIGTDADDHRVYEWSHDGQAWETWIDGGHLPTDARLLPIADLDTVRSASLPLEGYAVLLPGSGVAWIYDFATEAPMSLPLEAVGAAAAAGAAGAEERGLRASLFLRAMGSCPGSQAPCALYGPPRALLRASDPDAPPGGFYLRENPPASAPAGLAYHTTHHASPIEGVSLRVDTAVTAAGELVEAVTLVVGDRQSDAWVVIHPRGVIGAGVPGLVARGSHLYVYGAATSVHERATGRRIREYGVIRFEPHHDLCLAGDDGIWVVPVPKGPEVGFALFFEGSWSANYYERLDREPRRVALRAEETFLYGEAPVHGRLTTRGLRMAIGLIRDSR